MAIDQQNDRHRAGGLWLALVFCALPPSVPAQLAITEVLSSGSTNGLGVNSVRPDFWELTNFGTNDVNLEGYRWFDSENLPFASRRQLPPWVLKAGKSIVFFRANDAVRDTNAFLAWWGPGLPLDLQIHPWIKTPGLDGSEGDAVRLWDANSNLVDEVRFGEARIGFTFTYNTNSGEFTEFSEEGVAGAFRAAEGGDVGSPGFAKNGPVAVQIIQQPTDQTVDAGSEVTLRVQASGRPMPRFQWYTNGVSVPSAEASPPAIPRLVCFADCGPSWRRAPIPNELTLPNIHPGHAGECFVAVFNGLERLTSAVVTVTVTGPQFPIQVVCPPAESCIACSEPDSLANMVARPGQTVIFTVRHQGFPLPDLQWSRRSDGVNFTDLPSQTNRDLTISNVGESDAGVYRVHLRNSNGMTSAFARLNVRPPPQLEITEVMSQACTTDRDWWELTNTGTNAVNLCGFRWDDETTRTINGELIIGAGPTITNDVIVQPGESVIFMESQTAESFIHWWGASKLPPNLQFVRYAANGLGVLGGTGGSDGDSIYLWGPNETDPYNDIANVGFSATIDGVSLWFDPEVCDVSDIGRPSTEGDCGAFKADQTCDIGSPGWTRWTPPALTSVRWEASGVVLSWRAQAGSANRVQFARQLAVPLSATTWEDLGTFPSPQPTCVATDTTVGKEPQRFYRIMRATAAECLCPESLGP